MGPRHYSRLDQLLIRTDGLLTPLRTAGRKAIPAGTDEPGQALSAGERRLSARLMRVNHAGEVAAQGLYTGQAMTADSAQISSLFARLAEEESTHLAWCQTRLQELGGRGSLLNPAWLAGSIAIGCVAGLLGDRLSLGFVAETEKQVEAHLERHLKRLPANDHRSRTILLHMQKDEMAHGATAYQAGGKKLPLPLRLLMKASAGIMTTLAFRV